MSQEGIALDTETTGIDPKTNRLTEIAAVEFRLDTGELTGRTFHTYLNPEQEIPEEVVKVHGKTWDDLKSEPLFADKAKDFLDFIAGRHVVIHNAPFDVGHLNAELARVKGGKLDKQVASITDTLALSRRHVRAKKHTLDALCARYSVDTSKRTLHGALIDCELLALVYPPLMEDVRRTREMVNSILPFGMDAPLPETMEEAAHRWLVLEELKKLLESDQKRYSTYVKQLSEGNDVEGDGFEIEFTTRNSTDWEKVTKEHLSDVDLRPYRTQSSAMYIRHR